MKKLFTSFFILVSSFVFSQAPTFQWAKQIGGTSSDAGSSIVADGSGNVYTTGSFQGTVDFDPGAGVFNLTSHAGSSDIFISKLDATGNFIWAKNLGGNSSDYGRSIAIDASGNVYTTGGFQATADFDPGVGTYSLSAIGPADVFISKLDASGNFVWAKSIAADGGLSSSIAIDALGNVLTTGSFQGTVDFDPGLGVFNMTVAGTSFYDDVFINKLNASGTFVWAKRMGGTNYDNCYSISLDGTGNVYTTGYFSGTSDFDPGIGIFNLTSSSSSYDAFVSKLDSSGSFKWAKNMGGTGTVYPRSIVVDASGNVFTTGFFNGTDDFDPGSGIYNLSVTGNSFDLDVYFSKLDAFGTFVWAKSIGSVNSDYAYSISVDAVGNLYTSGAFAGTIDFDPGVGVYNLTSNGFYDIFVNKLDNSGLFMWAKNMGGTTSEYGFSVFSDPVGSV